MSFDFSAQNDAIAGTITAFGYPFSFGCWVKASNWTQENCAMNVASARLASDQCMINMGGATADEVRTEDLLSSGAVAVTYQAGVAEYDNTWVLVVAVVTGASDRDIYIDGSANTANSVATNTYGTIIDNIVIGMRAQGGFQWPGLVAEAFLYNIALSGAQVDALISSPDTLSQTGIKPTAVASANLVGYWPLDTDQASHADQGPNAGPTLSVESAAPFDTDHPTMVGNVSVTSLSATPFGHGDSVNIVGVGFEAVQGTGSVVISPADDIDDAGAVTQTIDSWADLAITITLVRGALSLDTNVYLFVKNDSADANPSGKVMQFLPNYELDFAELATMTFDMDFSVIPARPVSSRMQGFHQPHLWFQWGQ